MRASIRIPVVVALACLILATLAGTAAAASDDGRLGRSFVLRIDPGIPSDVAVQFARTALTAGLTRAETLRVVNDDRFRTAIGSPDQGYGLLEALAERPAAIRRAAELVGRRDLTASGADSLQNAILSIGLDVRNAYLEDLGHMVVARENGTLVLVDVETGRQIIGQGELGVTLRAPGGGPLPSPSPAVQAPQPLAPLALGQPPGGGVPMAATPSDWARLMPGLVLLVTLFAIAWLGYACVLVARRLRARR